MDRGGVLTNSLGVEKSIFWIFEITLYPAINIYALASGYVLVDKKIDKKRIIKLYTEVWFYSVIITTLTQVITHKISIKYLIKSVVPVTSNYYWYFTAYFGMYLLLPYINDYLQKIDKNRFKSFIITVIVLFSVMPTLKHGNVFGEINGYGIIWITVMYIIGAYIKLHSYDFYEEYRTRIIICFILCFLLNVCSHFLTSEIQSLKVFAEYLISYNSITMLVYSVLLFMLIVNVKQDKKGKNMNVLVLISQATFGIYLIHSNPMMTECYWNNKIYELILVENGHSIVRFFIVLILIFVVSLGISLIRNYIDGKIGISKLITNMYSVIERKLLKWLRQVI